MIVIPCSGGTLGSIAHGISRDLLQRAADVCLKERRPLVLAFRESPYSLVHIENMRAATLAGAIVAPPTPAFYVDVPDGRAVPRCLLRPRRASPRLAAPRRGVPLGRRDPDARRTRRGSGAAAGRSGERSGSGAGALRSLRTTLEMIKFSHTLFALPFALLAAVLAAGGWPRRIDARQDPPRHGRRAERGHGPQPAGRPRGSTRRTRARRPARCRRAPSRSASSAFSSPRRSPSSSPRRRASTA